MIVDLDRAKKIGNRKNHSSAEDGNFSEKPTGEHFRKENRNQFR